ncbi:MAG: site-specific integrase [Thaumarchaeota archaeon]|nr:site-specific integrase [Nitrososphaerota archaeon]
MGAEDYRERKARRSEKTAETYEGALRVWGRSLGYKDVDVVIEVIRDGKLDPYEALDKYIGYLVGKGKSPKTIRTYYGAVKGFLLSEGIPLDLARLKNRIVLPANYEVSMDRAPTQEELRSIVLRCGLRAKALVTLLASSGMRLGEATGLRVGDIDFTSKPTSIRLQARFTKTRKGRTVYVTDETSGFLKEWLGDRIKQLDQYVFFNEGNPKVRLTTDASYRQVMRAVEKAGLLGKMDADSKRQQIHPHSFRKYFFSQMLSAGVDRGIVELFMGHKFGLDAAYLRLTDDQLKQEYLKAEKRLTILTSPPEISRQDVEALIYRRALQMNCQILSAELAEYTEANTPLFEEFQKDNEELDKMTVEELGEYWRRLGKYRREVVFRYGIAHRVSEQVEREVEATNLRVGKGANHHTVPVSRQKIVSVKEAKRLVNGGKARFVSALNSDKAVVEIIRS